MKRINLIILIIILVSFGLAISIYPYLPEKMASHWNSRGNVDGYLGKF